LKVGDYTWKLYQGRTIDPSLSGVGFHGCDRFRLHNFTEKSEQDYFELCFPSNLLPDIAAGMTAKGKVRGFGSGWSVLVGEAWRFLGYSLAILISHSGGPKEDCWLEAGIEKYKNVFFLAPDLGRFGLTYSKYCKMMHAFTMPM